VSSAAAAPLQASATRVSAAVKEAAPLRSTQRSFRLPRTSPISPCAAMRSSRAA
jgi:hypothetical protein